MAEMLKEIQNGQFARELVAEIEAGAKILDKGRKDAKQHGIEKIGAHLRGMMPWLSSADKEDGDKE
jgi:ketol-acid reductoisomerase